MNITNITAKTGGYISNSVINSNFVRDLARLPMISQEDEQKYFFEIKKSKDRMNDYKDHPNCKELMDIENKFQLDCRNKIINGNLRLVYSAAKRYDNNDIVMELVNEGTEGMIEAFDDYDVSKGVRFGTYAMYYIKRRINAFLTKDNVMIRKTNDNKITPKVKKIENEFYLKEGYYPSAEEISDVLSEEYNLDNVNTIDIISTEITSIDAPVNSDDDSYTIDMDNMYTSKTASFNDYDEEIEMDSKRDIINRMLSSLTEREKIILTMSMGYNCDKEYTDAEISYEVGLTSERVRQIRKETIQKLQKFAAVRY
jgi:RNA polymerase primary sigma factor